MSNNKKLIKNGLLVNSNEITKNDILIDNGKIDKIGDLSDLSCDNIIDASNKYVLPGLIDPQVHFRDPGFPDKEDLKTGSMAAAAGGITTFFEMPNTNPSTTTIERLNQKFETASKKSIVNYSFFFGATPENLDEIKRLKNICGLKIFMGSSTGNLLVDNYDDLDKIFAACDRVIAVHAEDEQILRESSKTIEGNNFTHHPVARPVEAAVKATSQAIELALKHNKRLHVLHLSTAEEVQMIRNHKSSKLITCETTPQHLLMKSPDIYKEIGSFAQMNPPIRSERHQKELWKGLMDGTIDCIATDHAPHTLDEKKLPYGQAPSGMPGVETSLTLMLNEVSKGRISIENIVKLMSENPATLYKLKNKGFLKIGYDADITIVDMKKQKTISNKDVKSKCGWTAFDGVKTTGWPVTTIVNGNIVFENEELNFNFYGKRVDFEH